ncbi:unnamed protein product [Amoebophrya sp. A25]|nr:unnamed protein product [Amoebophrya sp. A25]|eukprot:GSA25T00006491001.1
MKVTDVKFPTLQMLKETIGALKEIDESGTVKFLFSTGEIHPKGILCRLKDPKGEFVCEYFLSSAALLTFDLPNGSYEFTFDCGEMLKLLKHGDMQDRVSLICDSETDSMELKIEHMRPPPAKASTYIIKASAIEKETVNAPPMDEVRKWPYLQMQCADFIRSCTRVADVMKSSGGVGGDKILRLIASKQNLSLNHEENESNLGFQVKWREEDQGPESYANKCPFHCQSMAHHGHDGWYNVHYLITLAKGGKQVSDVVNVLFPPDTRKMQNMAGFLFRLDECVSKAHSMDKHYNQGDDAINQILAPEQDLNQILEEPAPKPDGDNSDDDGMLRPRELIFEDDPKDKVIDLDDNILAQAPANSNARLFSDARVICNQTKKLEQKRHKQQQQAQADTIFADEMNHDEEDAQSKEDYEDQIQKFRETLKAKIAGGQLTLKQCQTLRDLTRGGPLDSIVIAECVAIANKYPDEVAKRREKMLNLDTKFGHLAFFCSSREAPKLNDLYDSESEEEGEKENTVKEELLDYYIWDRRKYLGADRPLIGVEQPDDKDRLPTPARGGTPMEVDQVSRLKEELPEFVVK